jgi:hypothetical protein
MPPGLGSSLTIRSRLLLAFVAVVALTAAAITVVTVVIHSRDARDRVVAQLRSVATLKEQQVTAWAEGLALNLDIALEAEGITADLSTLSTTAPGEDGYDAAHASVLRRFTRVSDQMGLFEELFFMGPEGQVLLSTHRGHERQQLGMNDYFTQGMGGSFIQEPSYALSLGKMTVVASRPVVYDGETVGVVAGRANLDSLNEVMIGRTGLGETGETYLVGSNHRLLTDLRRPGFSIPNAYIRTAGADAAVVDNVRAAIATYEGYAGDEVIGVYQWIPRLQVALLAEQEEAEALRATWLALWTTLGVALVATVFAIVAGILLIQASCVPSPSSARRRSASRPGTWS